MATSADEPTITIVRTEREEYRAIEQLFAQADASTVPSGILHWSQLHPYAIGEFDGQAHVGTCDQARWQQFLLELQSGSLTESTGAKVERVAAIQSRSDADGVTPIAIARFLYHTPRKMFTGRVLASSRSGLEVQAPATADEALERKHAVFASALLSRNYREFSEQPYVHHGLHVKFRVPRDGYLTNLTDAVTDLKIDFDDGHGPRDVAFDETIEIHYVDDLSKYIELEFLAGGERYRAAFRFALVDDQPDATAGLLLAGGREWSSSIPDRMWDVIAYQPYANIVARGHAFAYFGKGNNTRKLRSPLIFADGFGAGRTDFNEFWKLFNVSNLAQDILASGRDIVLLGYAEKSQYMQANAMVLVQAILQINRERIGTEPLVIGGASMGGLVARYALAFMEKHGLDHQASTYISYDSPHNGAWVPLSMQHFAYYFENQSDEAQGLANLLRSPAAQQLLYYHAESWQHRSNFGDNPLKRKFREELAEYGNWPTKVRKVGLANGTGNGIGNYLPPGAIAFEWWEPCCGAIPRTQKPGKQQPITGMWLGRYRDDFYTDDIVEFDGAPGGLGNFFGRAADGVIAARGRGALRQYAYKTSCFIPTVSALAFDEQVALYQDLTHIEPSRSALGAFKYSTQGNTDHVHVTRELADFFLAQL